MINFSKILSIIEGNRLTAFDILALRNGVPPRRLNEFWTFCFGEGYRQARIADLPDRWNNLHADVLILSPSNTVAESIKYMVAVWMTK